MKPLFTALTFIVITAVTQANETTPKDSISLSRVTKNSHLILQQWSPPNSNGVFNLAVEPGCGMLPVKLAARTDSSYTFQIIHFEELSNSIEHTKALLKISSNQFIVTFREVQSSSVRSKQLVSVTDLALPDAP